MKLFIVLALALASQAGFAATELDQESKVTNIAARAQDLPQTVVIRVNNKTGEKEIVEMTTALSEKELSAQEVEKLAFKKFEVDEKYASTTLNEVDRDAARESWYYYVGYYPYSYGYGYNPYAYGYSYYPNYYYGGYYYPYSAYYGYNYYNYSYYYYRPYRWW
jgi:hypothetical protein